MSSQKMLFFSSLNGSLWRYCNKKLWERIIFNGKKLLFYASIFTDLRNIMSLFTENVPNRIHFQYSTNKKNAKNLINNRWWNNISVNDEVLFSFIEFCFWSHVCSLHIACDYYIFFTTVIESGLRKIQSKYYYVKWEINYWQTLMSRSNAFMSILRWWSTFSLLLFFNFTGNCHMPNENYVSYSKPFHSMILIIQHLN